MLLLLLLGIAALGVAVFLASEAVTLTARQREGVLKQAVSYGERHAAAIPIGHDDFRQRALVPAMAGLARGVLRLTPKATLESVSAKLLSAGLGRRISPTSFLATKGLLTAVGIPLGATLGASSSSSSVAVLFAGMSGVMGFFLPDVLVTLRARSRRDRLRAELPDALDLLAVSVEAGLGFDAALAKLAEHMEGPLIDEFSLTLGEMRIGESRENALKKMADRTGIAEIAAFTRAMIQADQLGISLGRILRVQAADTRLRRQAAAEEKAMRAPIKMLFPTVIFIFPAMFIVILGPAFLNLKQFF